MIYIVILLTIFQLMLTKPTYAAERFFSVQSVDTVKYSRDVAQDMEFDIEFDNEIDQQVSQIAAIGATHIAIGTPYDEEFVPFLKRWVSAARKYNLHIWFRGNFSGWEGWFSYDPMERQEHIEKTVAFIKNHPDIFEDGDIFTSCPECENGGPGDPRFTGDTEGHRKFLIDEYTQVKNAFYSIDKLVTANYYSMNGDVARLIMDKETTKALDGVVTIDHYVRDSDTLMQDVATLQEQSGGKIVIGEIGAPIPDINGEMTDEEQAAWLEDLMKKLVTNPSIIAVNYWVNRGGTTRIWNSNNSPKPAANVLNFFYKPTVISGKITNDVGIKLNDVKIITKHRTENSENGTYTMPIFDDPQIRFMKDGYISVTVDLDKTDSAEISRNIILKPTNPSWFYKIIRSINSFFRNIF